MKHSDIEYVAKKIRSISEMHGSLYRKIRAIKGQTMLSWLDPLLFDYIMEFTRSSIPKLVYVGRIPDLASYGSVHTINGLRSNSNEYGAKFHIHGDMDYIDCMGNMLFINKSDVDTNQVIYYPSLNYSSPLKKRK